MSKKLFLLDGMGLVYRAHFALIHRPIFTSKGVNTSALYGFTQTLLEIIKNQKPTHLAVVFDTEAPTQRHKDFPEYKSQREAMPEDLSKALPHVRRMIEAFNIAVITCDGFEADDVIGTLIGKAELEGFESYMVTSDKDFGQLVSEKVFLYKPSRMGDGVEILGLPEILSKWGIQKSEQVIDILALWGDASDNIPGVPGIGEKTASKLISQYGSVENLLAHTGELKGKLKETLEINREQALLSKRLATICREAPCDLDLDRLKIRELNSNEVKSLCVEFEFNALGKRLFGDAFKAGRGFESPASPGGQPSDAPPTDSLPLTLEDSAPLAGRRSIADETSPEASATASASLKTIAEVDHLYHLVSHAADRELLINALLQKTRFCFSIQTDRRDPKQARLLGLSFCFEAHTGYYVPLPSNTVEAMEILNMFRTALENTQIEKIGHDLKFEVSVLQWHGLSVRGKLFDTMLAHALIEPEMRHSLDYLAEAHLGYCPMLIGKLMGAGNAEQLALDQVAPEKMAEFAAERVDVVWQLRSSLEPLLRDKGQERVFYEIEAPLLPVLVEMEVEGVRVDAAALAEFSTQLEKEMDAHEKTICRLAGREFNVNSPRQLGEILFEVLRICESPKKTKTGQYATDEQTLAALAPQHEIVQRLMEYRVAAKLKSTYADTLPQSIWPKTGRIHTTYHQAATATGRLNSQNPNLQNIPIRSEQGKEIRKAFVPRSADYELLSADYSQIELRIIAALSHETAMLEAFKAGLDIHTATAARVYGVFLDLVTPEMRRKAKMVNYGIAYGISAFGLAQRLGIPRKEATAIIDQYFAQFPGIRKYMSDTVAFAKEHGYVETVTGRRRYLRDIRSSNATIRGSAERNAINAPIQGSAADMIKIAMANIHRGLAERGLKTRMLLQVHDELVFDLYKAEEKEVLPLVEEKMKTAIPLEVPIVVEMGKGKTWLEAH
jgi:DNA polymerase-1